MPKKCNPNTTSKAGDAELCEHETTVQLMQSLKKQFHNVHVRATEGNYYLALRNQTNDLTRQALYLTSTGYEQKKATMANELKQVLCKSYGLPFDAREEYVDTKVEGDIRFFDPTYTRKQAEIFKIRR